MTDLPLRERLDDALKNERHMNRQETMYWFNQYKSLATDAVARLLTLEQALADATAIAEAVERNRELLIDALRAKGLPDSWLSGIAAKAARIKAAPSSELPKLVSLIAEWRENARRAGSNSESVFVSELDRRQCLGVSLSYEQCADELEAALAASRGREHRNPGIVVGEYEEP